MAKKTESKEALTQEKEINEDEEFISRDDIDIEVMSALEGDTPTVWIKFTNFEDEDDAEEYAQFLAETLPLLLFETTRLQ